MNLSRAVLVAFFVFFLTACISHRNTSIIDPGFKLNDNSSKEDFMKARGLLAELALRNFSLAVELGRLPEVQAANTPSIPEAIQHLIRLYDQYPGEFQKALDQMFSIGLPQYRRYNTPLQALFWLAEDKKVESARKIVKKYQLIDLLRIAWDQDDIINQPTDHTAMEMHKKRWGHFNVVIDRLNSPELIDFYEKKYFKYNYHRSDDTHDSYSIFQIKTGNCIDYANFTYHCLSRAGYNSWKLSIPNHMTVIIKGADEKYYALDNARWIYNKQIGLAGPFDNMEELIRKLHYFL